MVMKAASQFYCGSLLPSNSILNALEELIFSVSTVAARLLRSRRVLPLSAAMFEKEGEKMDRAGFCRGAASVAAATAGLATASGLQPSLAADVVGGTGRNKRLVHHRGFWKLKSEGS